MFPSKSPLLYIIHMAIILVTIMCAILVGAWHLNQPLALLSLLALNFIPDWPLVQQMPAEEEEIEEPGYAGKGTTGFAPG